MVEALDVVSVVMMGTLIAVLAGHMSGTITARLTQAVACLESIAIVAVCLLMEDGPTSTAVVAGAAAVAALHGVVTVKSPWVVKKEPEA
ncbi:hypothetical protein ABT282_08090 [Streptomyces sp. NPDC000927]|uniref:hypothetical protein n=1 Tax=Streptomyces sp. NPDC000927 TaxID=3154371 RepID=UPI00332FAE89